MNIKQFIKLAKPVINKSSLHEDAGSEGMLYKAIAPKGLKTFENEVFKIEDVKSENGVQTAQVSFAYPHDCGYAESVLLEALDGLESVKLELIY